MGSDIILRPTLRQKEWEARKGRVGAGLGEIGAFVLKKAKDLIGDIRAIKEKELWREGGYTSFGDFVDRMIGVSQRQIYRLLNEDDETRKVLGIRETFMTECHKQALPPSQESQPEKPPEKSLNDPPEPKKKRGRKPKPRPIEATFTEEQAPPAQLPNSANVIVTTTDSTRVCPHCGGAL